MKKSLLFASVLMLSTTFVKAQQVAFQGFEGTGSNNWSYTFSPAKYNTLSASDVWGDETVVGYGTAAISPYQGNRFWAMRDLENPTTSSLPSPYYHYIDFSTLTLNTSKNYQIKFRYSGSITGGSSDSVGYIVEYNNGSTWSSSNYTFLPRITNGWVTEIINVPANSQYLRLRMVSRINGGDDWTGLDDFEVIESTPPPPPPPTVDILNEVSYVNEGDNIARIPVVISNRNSSPTVAYFKFFQGLSSASSMNIDFSFVTPSLTFFPGGPDTLYMTMYLNDDKTNEITEYAMFEMDAIINGTIGDKYTTLYIKDNDSKGPQERKNIELVHLSSLKVDTAAGGSAEVVAYDSASNRIFALNSTHNKLHILNFSKPSAMTQVTEVDMSAYGGGINSVAAHNGIVAVASEANTKTDSGSVVFMNTNGVVQKVVKVGALPDMLTFTHDGKYVLVANEGEPNDDYSVDPEGSVSIIDMQNGVANAAVTGVSFTSLNGNEAALRAAGVRIFGYNNPTAAMDLEPEYIAVNTTSDTAYVSLQENNAIAVIHIPSKTLLTVAPLGYIDHSKYGNAIDASDRTDGACISTWPVKGMMMPDAIAHFNVKGTNYLITANEGDAREYGPFEEEVRIGSSKYVLDPLVFDKPDLLKANHNLGRLTATNTMGDIDNDGDFDEIYVFGGRSISIFNTSNGSLVYNSGSMFENIIANHPVYSKIFNCSNDENDPKTRSDAKGPEPEGVTTGVINDTTYAFVALERIGGIVVLDVNNPAQPTYVQYINTRSVDSVGGDLGAEVVMFLHKDKNPNKKHYVVSANEVSGTVAVFEVKAWEKPDTSVYVSNLGLKRFNVYPNPATNELHFGVNVTGELVDVNGRVVVSFEDQNTINVANLPRGMYFLRAEDHMVERVVIQ